MRLFHILIYLVSNGNEDISCLWTIVIEIYMYVWLDVSPKEGNWVFHYQGAFLNFGTGNADIPPIPGSPVEFHLNLGYNKHSFLPHQFNNRTTINAPISLSALNFISYIFKDKDPKKKREKQQRRFFLGNNARSFNYQEAAEELLSRDHPKIYGLMNNNYSNTTHFSKKKWL